MTRPDWDEYFMSMARLAASRSSCVRRGIGAVVVKDNHVIATGYNGPPRNAPHRTNETCVRTVENIPSGQKTDRVCCAHAEANAIAQAAMHGHPTDGATLYCTNAPCAYCARFIINAGIVRVVYKEGYPDDLASSVFAESNIPLECYGDGGDFVPLATLSRSDNA